MNNKSRIIGTGSYLPKRILTNKELAKTVETSDDWIVERTGIRQRHIAADNETTADIAYQAALRAPDHAWLRPSSFIEVKDDGLDSCLLYTSDAADE